MQSNNEELQMNFKEKKKRNKRILEYLGENIGLSEAYSWSAWEWEQKQSHAADEQKVILWIRNLEKRSHYLALCFTPGKVSIGSDAKKTAKKLTCSTIFGTNYIPSNKKRVK